ncbi:hypothetical protein [Bradyrhizobium sp. BR 1432]|uniref:hypothetical protein n=1 Tax=Bradyrhizobium sp. BR 1432 TaxID=3447966 RepID=UPI003EE4FA5B
MILFCALSAPAFAIDLEIAAYNRCVSDESMRLSAGSNAADLIAKNAAVLCGGLLAKMLERNPNLVGGQLTAYENHAVGEATLAVLESRAKKRQ